MLKTCAWRENELPHTLFPPALRPLQLRAMIAYPSQSSVSSFEAFRSLVAMQESSPLWRPLLHRGSGVGGRFHPDHHALQCTRTTRGKDFKSGKIRFNKT